MRWILGVDTSCDDTGVGLIDADDGSVRANVVASQTDVHAAFGGVVPERASREHLERIDHVLERALTEAGGGLDDVVGVAATRGPGLVGALLVGLCWAKGLAFARGVPFAAVHHLDGHVASAGADVHEPSLCLIASGGHTLLLQLRPDAPPRWLGASRDDAAGEAFDKVARMLGLPFPGGPALARLAGEGDPDAHPFTPPLRRQSGYDFSFSGLKTAVATLLERDPTTAPADVAASFERTVVDALVGTLTRAAADHGIDRVIVAGGVAANERLRAALRSSGLRVTVPPLDLATDNGAMIAMAARRRLSDPHATSDWSVDAAPYLPLVARDIAST
ncbi:MAG: tRNA (adenosine(37)-N6)-threonylcarbamoyltransferase complex transferase subunit TsaD [Trueperaceae bacterium]